MTHTTTPGGSQRPLTRRAFLKASVTLGALLGAPLSRADLRAALAAAPLSDGLAALPAGLAELSPGQIWHGPHTPSMTYALLRRLIDYDHDGVDPRLALGIDKGSLFLRGPDGHFYEFAVSERGVYHIAGAALQRSLVVRNLTYARVQLDTENQLFYELPPPALAILAARPVAGDAGSLAPTLLQIRQLLTINGLENHDHPELGQPARKLLGRMGVVGRAPDDLPPLAVGDYRNGHNLPQETLSFLERSYGPRALEILGLPISDPYWMELSLGGWLRWVLWQAFERGTVTYTPANPPEWQFEGGLAGNLFIAALNGGSDQLPPLNSYVAPRPFANAIGWAFSPRYDVPREEIALQVGQLRDLGMDTLYVSHANPARQPVHAAGLEVGLCPAVYHALKHNTAERAGAEWILHALGDTLDAAQAAGLKVLLAVGYQSQMGDEWSAMHPDDLRRSWDGGYLNSLDETRMASPYAWRYQQDILEYYQWVNQTIVARYDNIVGINIADEPMGVDYSAHARRAFAHRYGLDFDQAGAGQQGEFLAGVLADYVVWSAALWRAINPRLWTTGTLHIQREMPWFPDVEQIFERAPESYLFSADTHWHDAGPEGGLVERELHELVLMCRTLGWLGHVYGRRLIPWAGANAWSLAYSEQNRAEGVRYGGVAEARQNFRVIHDDLRLNGGTIAFVLAWAANIRGQEHPEQAALLEAISAEMVAARATLSQPAPHATSPDCILTYDAATLHDLAGQRKVSHLVEVVGILERLAELGHDFYQTVVATNTVILRSNGRAYREALARKPGATVIQLF